MNAITAISNLLTEVFKLANSKINSKYINRKIEIDKELAKEYSKAIYSDDGYEGLRDQARIDKLEREMFIIAEAVIRELKK